VIVDDHELESRILRVNTDKLNRASPLVVTCGTEQTQWAVAFTDLLDRFFSEELKMAALRFAINQFEKDIRARYRTGELS